MKGEEGEMKGSKCQSQEEKVGGKVHIDTQTHTQIQRTEMHHVRQIM